ncbi:MAG: 50S ribosomal protein L22 [Pseudomonadota bacterium]
MEVTAKTRYTRIAPRKLRLVADMIRGQMVSKAISTLKFTPKRGGKIMYKTLMSAVANAETKATMDVDNLYVKKVWVDEGPMMKRYMPKAQGRATEIRKKMSHLNIVLDEK